MNSARRFPGALWRVFRGRARREDGQALVIVVGGLVALLAMAGFTIDVGRVYVAQRTLQQAVDASALAASVALPSALGAQNAANNYSMCATCVGGAPGLNQKSNFPASPPVVTPICLTTIPNGGPTNVPCKIDIGQTKTTGTPPQACSPTGAVPPASPANGWQCNAVKVTETANVTTTFLNVLGIGSLLANPRASATVLMRGGTPHPLDIMMVLDVTGSMNDKCTYDVATPVAITHGWSTKLDCAKEGIRQLLEGLYPCDPTDVVVATNKCPAPTGGVSPNPEDQVGLEVFPGLNCAAPPTAQAPCLPGTTAYTHDTTGTTMTNGKLEFACSGRWNNGAAVPAWYTSTPYGGPQNVGPPTFPAGIANRTGTGFPLEYSDEGYLNPSGYQIVPLVGDFRADDVNGSDLNTSSLIVQASYWGNCPNGVPSATYANNSYPNSSASFEYYGAAAPYCIANCTAYADAITQAYTSMEPDMAARGAQGVIILLSDGDANVNGPNACQAGIQQAATAASLGFWVYSVAYDAATTSNNHCGTDAATNEVQTVLINATGGQYVLNFNGASTNPLNWNATAGTVQAALRALSTINGNYVNVNAVTGGYTVTFIGNLASQNVPQMTAVNALTGGTASITITTTTPGNGAQTPQVPWTVMSKIASDPSKFYCLPAVTGCADPTANTLAKIFSDIGADLQGARIVPGG